MKHKPLLPTPRSRAWVHIIWTTKDQMNRLPFEKRNKLFLFLRSFCEQEHIYLDVVNGMSDHIHLLMMMNPRYALSEMIHRLQEASEQYLKETYLWDNSYRAFSVSPAKIPYVRRQVLRQAKIHRSLSLEQELWELEPMGNSKECIIIGTVQGISDRVIHPEGNSFM